MLPSAVSAVDSKSAAEIEIQKTDSINERLSLVTDLVRNTEYPGKVAVISRLRRQLIPYQIYYASDGAPFQTAVDLDVFSSSAFDALVSLMEIWERSQDSAVLPGYSTTLSRFATLSAVVP